MTQKNIVHIFNDRGHVDLLKIFEIFVSRWKLSTVTMVILKHMEMRDGWQTFIALSFFHNIQDFLCL